MLLNPPRHHRNLQGLDYASSGHVGFMSTQGGTFTGPVRVADRLVAGVVSYPYAASITVDCDNANTVNIGLLTGDVTINVSGAPFDGQILCYRFTQDSVGGWAITWTPATFNLGTPVPSMPSAPSAAWEVFTKYNAADGKWRVFSPSQNFA